MHVVKRARLLYVFTAVFVAAELALGILLQVTGGGLTVLFSYLAVVLACLFCVLFCEPSRIYAVTQGALICTVCADWFLVVTDPRQQLPAMIFFSAAQLLYASRLFFAQTDRTRCIHVWIRSVLSLLAGAVTVGVLGDACDAVALVSMFYYANLILNLVYAFLAGRGERLFFVGLLLFLLCDTVIGLSCLDPYFTVSSDSFLYRIIHPGFNLAWVFYVPSQALIALSLLPRALKRNV